MRNSIKTTRMHSFMWCMIMFTLFSLAINILIIVPQLFGNCRIIKNKLIRTQESNKMKRVSEILQANKQVKHITSRITLNLDVSFNHIVFKHFSHTSSLNFFPIIISIGLLNVLLSSITILLSPCFNVL